MDTETIAVLSLLIALVAFGLSQAYRPTREQGLRKMSKKRRSSFLWSSVIGGLAFLLFAGIEIRSLWLETLSPFLRQKNDLAVALELAGFLLGWLSVGLLGYGALIFVRNTLMAAGLFLSKAGVREGEGHPAALRKQADAHPSARRANFLQLLRVWKPALLWLVLGVLAGVLAAFLIRLAESG